MKVNCPRENEPWNDYERMLVLLTPRKLLRELSAFLGRPPDAAKMKKDTLMFIYAELKGLGRCGLSDHAKADVEFMRRWHHFAPDEFKLTAYKRALENRKKDLKETVGKAVEILESGVLSQE